MLTLLSSDYITAYQVHLWCQLILEVQHQHQPKVPGGSLIPKIWGEILVALLMTL